MNATVTPLREDVEAVWSAAKDGFGAADFVALIRAGVPKEVLAAHLYRDLWPGALDIAIENGKWRQMFRGERAIVLPVTSPETGELVDLVAFRPQTPRSFWRFIGTAPLLGYDSLALAEYETRLVREDHDGRPGLGILHIHETPLDWIKSGCAGVVILDWKHYWPAYFGAVVALRAKDLAVGRWLTGILERPLPSPDVLVPV
jgi:hypothetical protein